MGTIILIVAVCVIALIAILATGKKADENWKDDREPSVNTADKENK